MPVENLSTRPRLRTSVDSVELDEGVLAGAEAEADPAETGTRCPRLTAICTVPGKEGVAAGRVPAGKRPVRPRLATHDNGAKLDEGEPRKEGVAAGRVPVEERLARPRVLASMNGARLADAESTT